MTPPIVPAITPPTPARAPRTTERLLAALGADADLREALLGDMAEEHALRTAWDGARAARRWYRREALRVAPHLLRDWARRLRWRGVGRVLGIVLTAYVFATMVVGAILVTLQRVTGPLWPARGELRFGTDDPLQLAAVVAITLALRFGAPVLAGYFAAMLDEAAPLASALAVGVTMAGVGVVTLSMMGPLHAWGLGILLAQCLAMPVVTLLGGMLRVWRTSGPRAMT